MRTPKEKPKDGSGDLLRRIPSKSRGKGQGQREIMRAMSFFSRMAVTVAACVILGVLAGKFLDDRLGTTPWLLLVFSLLGTGAAFKSLFDYTMKK